MASVRKLNVVGEAELTRLKAKQIREYDPEISVIARLENEIDKILNDNSKSDTEKLAELRSAQSRSRNLRAQEAPTLANVFVLKGAEPEPTPRPTPTPTAVEGVVDQGTTSSGSGEAKKDLSAEEQILIDLPKNKREKAQRLLHELEKHPDLFKLDPNSRRILVGNEQIEGSNFIDIFDYALSKPGKGKTKPKGIQEFYAAMTKANIPQSFVTRPDAFHKIDLPPGKVAEILRVYPEA